MEILRNIRKSRKIQINSNFIGVKCNVYFFIHSFIFLPGAIATTTVTASSKASFRHWPQLSAQTVRRTRRPHRQSKTKRSTEGSNHQTRHARTNRVVVHATDLPTASKLQKRATQRNKQRYKMIKPKPQEPAVYVKSPPPPRVVMLPYDQLPTYQSYCIQLFTMKGILERINKLNYKASIECSEDIVLCCTYYKRTQFQG